MATAAAANANANSNTNAQPGAGLPFNSLGHESSIRTDHGAVLPTKQEQEGSTSIEMEMTGIRPPGQLVRRASASGQLMRVDESVRSNTDTADIPKRRRSLVSSSSSPTSLRALFNAGAPDTRPLTMISSQPPLPTETSDARKPIENALGDQTSVIQDGHSDPTGNAGGNARFDYFDHPIPYSDSSSSSSTPSGVMVTGGVAHYGYPFESMSNTVAHLISPLSSPLCHAQPSSLPPTPLHLVAESSPDSVMAGPSSTGLGRFAPGHSQFQTPSPHPRHSAPRRASSSSYLPSSHSTDSDIKVHHDRRISAPWGAFNHHYEGRVAMPGSGGVQDVQPYPTQSALMRSNSTPAALRSPLKSLNRNRHSALPSRRSHIGPARQSMNLYASTDKVIQDLSLPQQLYRNSALQFQLHLQQLQQSHQQGQRSQSLPRYQPEQVHHPMLQQPQQNMVQWQTYGIPRQLQQETDLNFELGVSNPQPEMAMRPQTAPLAHGIQTPDAFAVLPPTDIMSPVSVHSPVQQPVADPQPLAGSISTPIQANLPEGLNSIANIGGIVNRDLLAQQPIQHPSSQEEQLQPKLQFAQGYVWKQEESNDRVAHGHARHQSASQVYPQHGVQVQPPAHNRTNWTRSLQGDLTGYTALVDHQQRLADHTQVLQKETPIAHPTTLDQKAAQDSFGASLALDLNDHLRLLDDEFSQQSQGVPPHNHKDTLLPNSAIAGQTDQTLVGSPTSPIQVHHPQRSIFSTIAGSGSGSQDQMILEGSGISNDLGQGTEMLHYPGNQYIDALSFLDLSGTYMASTAGMSATGPSASTSSSLPNSSFLNHQGERMYTFLPNVPQQPVVPNLHTQMVHIPQGQQHPPPPPPPPPQQINIIHHQHHHHHHHHIH